MVVYRKDLFDAAGLAAPTSYAAIEAALDALHNLHQCMALLQQQRLMRLMSQVLEHVF